jgi:chromate reductase
MTPKVLVFAGSTRTDSLHRKLARNAAAALQRHGLDVTLADLRDYPMPLYDGDLEAESGLPDTARAFRTLLAEHDVFVIASPEYNGSFPALVKNAIDWASRSTPGEAPTAVFRGKTAALLAASPGPGGGSRGLRHLRELLQMIGVTVLPADVTIPKAFSAFDTEGGLMRPADIAAVERVGEVVLASAAAASAAA